MGAETVLLTSAAVGVAGGVYSGFEANSAAKKQAGIYDEQANAEQSAGAFQEAQAVRDFDTLLGEQKLSFAASGRELEGSPLLILDQTIRDKETEISNIRSNTSRSVSQLRSAAKETKKAGRNAILTGIIGGAGSAGKASNYYQAAQNPTSRSILGASTGLGVTSGGL
ncbi:hypothetical protein UFOVP1451_46 [uncultured Caudovirales phage]|uniref:Uncharacterized protein n=1 Tax=uncultured Caudovirales phage TaxID=2100421 RepID=A0A6J5SGL5_9CAUD|nr:hypothetical protein UFOVP1451_46 [uncultured Caudovirales phage]